MYSLSLNNAFTAYHTELNKLTDDQKVHVLLADAAKLLKRAYDIHCQVDAPETRTFDQIMMDIVQETGISYSDTAKAIEYARQSTIKATELFLNNQ